MPLATQENDNQEAIYKLIQTIPSQLEVVFSRRQFQYLGQKFVHLRCRLPESLFYFILP